MLVVPLDQPGRLRVTVFGPGPSCNRLGTYGRRGRAGVNRVAFSGRLFGRPLPPGSYAVVIEVVRGSTRVRVGRVLVQILPRDGREGASRPLVAPDCSVQETVLSSLAAFGDFVRATGGGAGAGGGGTFESAQRTAGVAGVSEATGQREPRRSQPGLPPLPPLPPLPSIDSGSPLDSLASPFFVVGLLALLGAAAAAAAVVYGVRRRREAFWY